MKTPFRLLSYSQIYLMSRMIQISVHTQSPSRSQTSSDASSPAQSPPESICAPVIKEPLSPLYLAVGLMFEKSEHLEKIMCIFVR